MEGDYPMINGVKAVRAFFRRLSKMGINVEPVMDFRDIPGVTLTAEEANGLNARLRQCWAVCNRDKADIFEIAREVKEKEDGKRDIFVVRVIETYELATGKMLSRELERSSYKSAGKAINFTNRKKDGALLHVNKNKLFESKEKADEYFDRKRKEINGDLRAE